MEICKYCGHKKLWKAGIATGKQRYQCPKCKRTMSEIDGREKYTEQERETALTLYLERCGFRRVARIMTKIYGKLFHNQTIIQWVREAGEQAQQERKTQTPMEIVEMDELYTYVKKKDLRTRVWTTVDRNKNRICKFFVGAGNRRSLRKLVNKIGTNNLKIVCTDGNFAYESELGMITNVRHLISKSETCLVESYNSVLRYY